MNYKNNYFRRFFWSHLCLIIPVLIVSLIITSFVSNVAGRKEQEKMARQLADTSLRFYDDIMDFADEATLLASQNELMLHRLSGSWKEIKEAIELLDLRRRLDNDFSDLFIDLGGEKIYSSEGLTRKSVYLEKLFLQNEVDLVKFEEILEGEDSRIEILYTTEKHGYIIYSFHVDKTGERRRSFNYLLTFEQVVDMLNLKVNELYELETASGRTFSFCYDEIGKLKIMDRNSFDEITSNSNFVLLEEQIPVWGIVLRQYYDGSSVRENDGLYHIWFVNIMLILAGIFSSAVISWNMSTRRIKEISTLEAILKGKEAERISERSIFNQLQNSILLDISKRKEFELKALEDSYKLREAVAHQIFNGKFRDRDEFCQLVTEVGVHEIPNTYCIGTIATKQRIDNHVLMEMMSCCVMAHTSFRDYKVVLFLYPMKTLDKNRLFREKLAEEIRSYLYEKERNLDVYIGLSSVYTDEKRINSACEEAFFVLEKLVGGEISDFSKCWEDVVKNVFYLLPDTNGLYHFGQALQNKNMPEAEKWFHYVLNGCNAKGCTDKNRIYIRYSILQYLVQYLSEEDRDTNAHLIKECLNMNVTDERKYIQNVEKVLNCCLADREKDSFAKILDYIEVNYYRSDLTYEMVAIAGDVNKTYVSKIFRDKLGMSYIEYITQLRLNKAASYLRTTDYNVSIIAGMVGYDNLSSFGRSFKNKYGMSALEYRRKYREGKTEKEYMD